MGKNEREKEKLRQKSIGFFKGNPYTKGLMGNVRAIMKGYKIAKMICPACLQKKMKNPKLKFKDFCPTCQEKLMPQLKKLHELIKK